ncbi:MAG: hypothetical protein GTO42_01315 [Candidatus Latescibacteria bacterium]|nr:hypothetical protein [Candidatus Latescibacterota bacterium]NIO27168.1 hypothetical protein [Candidatus Latescibacterota bacterium]NIO54692.1 hypothetical protein [Candidatus Latescibacterota bacterium]NIT00775.1 hypothetical protein [Candidatus Latescibacterota bacterium]NIT37698.1 hypothetical protein [Candidatus Latescibacterota bacterium]
MRGYLLRIVLFLLLISTPLHAEMVEIALPDIQGLYSVDSTYTRTAHFQMDRAPIEVHDVWIRLCGIADTGLLSCEGPYGQEILGPWWTHYEATMKDSTTGLLWGASYTYEDSSSALDFTMKFQTQSQATWDFMKQGTGDLSLMWCPLPYVLTCSEIIVPSVEITNAHLIIDGDFPVPVEINTWGAIKSLYSISK